MTHPQGINPEQRIATATWWARFGCHAIATTLDAKGKPKKPIGTDWQNTPATPEAYTTSPGFGIVPGPKLYVPDFDGKPDANGSKAVDSDRLAREFATAEPELFRRLATGNAERSMSDGLHFAYTVTGDVTTPPKVLARHPDGSTAVELLRAGMQFVPGRRISFNDPAEFTPEEHARIVAALQSLDRLQAGDSPGAEDAGNGTAYESPRDHAEFAQCIESLTGETLHRQSQRADGGSYWHRDGAADAKANSVTIWSSHVHVGSPTLQQRLGELLNPSGGCTVYSLWAAAHHEPLTDRDARDSWTASQAGVPGQPGPSLLGGMRDGGWLDGQTFKPLRYHVDRLVPEGLTVLVGPPKVGKSWMVLMWALDIAAAGRLVIYFALEDSDRRMQSRCRKLLAGKPIPAGFRYITSVPPGGIVAAVAEAVATFGTPDEPPLIIIDTLGKVLPPALSGETPYMRDYRITADVKRVADSMAGGGVLITHHDRKADAADFVDAVSGTHGIAGAADTILVLTRPRNEASGLLQITGRDVDEDEFAITLGADCRWTLDGGTPEVAAATARVRKAKSKLGDVSAGIIDFVMERGAKGTRAADVAAAFDMPGNDAGTYLRRLADTKRIVSPARGVFAPYGVEVAKAALKKPPPGKSASEVSESPVPADQAPVTDQTASVCLSETVSETVSETEAVHEKRSSKEVYEVSEVPVSKTATPGVSDTSYTVSDKQTLAVGKKNTARPAKTPRSDTSYANSQGGDRRGAVDAEVSGQDRRGAPSRAEGAGAPAGNGAVETPAVATDSDPDDPGYCVRKLPCPHCKGTDHHSAAGWKRRMAHLDGAE